MLLCTHRTRRFTSLLVGPIGGLDAGTIIENVELRTAPASCLFELAAVYDVVDVVFMNCVDCENLGLDFFGVCSLRRSFCLRVAIAFKVVECVFFCALLCPALFLWRWRWWRHKTRVGHNTSITCGAFCPFVRVRGQRYFLMLLPFSSARFLTFLIVVRENKSGVCILRCTYLGRIRNSVVSKVCIGRAPAVLGACDHAMWAIRFNFS